MARMRDIRGMVGWLPVAKLKSSRKENASVEALHSQLKAQAGEEILSPRRVAYL